MDHSRHIWRAAFAALFLTLSGGVFVCGAFAQEALDLPANVEEIYMAKDNGEGKPGEPSETFFTTDLPIFCVVILNTTKPTTVKMNFVASLVPGVKAESKIVSASYTTKDGEDRVFFTGKPNTLWPAGKYRADVFVNGKLAKNQEFEIIGRTASSKAENFVKPKPKPITGPKKN